ncbi:Trk system potassium transporter TrkA [Persicobacter psychrovividus]|uniref:Trk system potassium uptake protein TrkA n=1 Tax=Persicobacter psychrovividus TaxID=387638 RepID=A0ABM7VGR5_9BACT|nr:Trk system potassium transport protein TrkA [Persicobacter psychrovividus]
MHIVIAGAGEVGFHLAKQLAHEQKDIVIIDTDKERLQYVSNQLDVATIEGNSIYYDVLKDAEVAKADLLIAVTPAEETNLATCMIGKKLGAQRTVARINNVDFLSHRQREDLRSLGIDELISPESLAAREIKRLLREAALTDTFEFDRGMLSLIGIHIEEGDPFAGVTLKDSASLNKNRDFVIVAVLRDGQTIIPDGDTRLEVNDYVYFIAEPTGVDAVFSLKGGTKKRIKDIMILGGSRTGLHAARKLSERTNKYRVKLVEKDKEKCFLLADQLPEVLVINGDSNDVSLLKEEGLEEMDAFIAVTGNSETNIISCLLAKNNNVQKTIALVENMDYIHLSQAIGVDTMINKKLIAANFICRYLRRGNVLTVTSVHGVDAEVMEFEVRENSAICFQKVRDLDFPEGAIIGGVIRNTRGFTTMGNFEFNPKDHVVVLCKPEAIRVVERFFK